MEHNWRQMLIKADVRFLIGRLGSSTFRLSTTAVSMSLTGSRFYLRYRHLAPKRR